MAGSFSAITEKLSVVTVLHSDVETMGATAASFREGRRGQIDIWSSIQQSKNEADKMIMVEKKREQSDAWSSIMSKEISESETCKSSIPTYVHPLVKGTKSSLGVRSLEICTECLGSETGSDGFSSCPPSLTGDAEDEDKEEQQEHQQSESVEISSQDPEEEEVRSTTKYPYSVAPKKVTAMTFPPPLPSLSRRDGVASPRMRSVRDNGRLVVEVVSGTSRKNFRAVRRDGRLVLTFVEDCDSQEPNEDDGIGQEIERERMGEEFAAGIECEDERTEETLEVEKVEMKDRKTGIEDVEKPCNMKKNPRLAFIMTPSELGNKNPSCSCKLDESVKLQMAEEEEDADGVRTTATPVVQSLLPGFLFPENVPMQNERRQVSASREKKGDCLLPMSKTCKDSRGATLLWEPYCIATS